MEGVEELGVMGPEEGMGIYVVVRVCDLEVEKVRVVVKERGEGGMGKKEME